MPTITATLSAETTEPELIHPWSTRQRTPTVVQDVVGSSTPWVSLGEAYTREGVLEFFYSDEADADAARQLLGTIDSFTIDYPERPSLEFSFVVTGDLEMRLDPDTTDHWVVAFAYRELGA